MLAIVLINGKQYIVSPGEKIVVPHIEGESGQEVSFPDVLLVSDDNKTKIGIPYVKGLSVQAKIISHKKGEKITVRRFKSKVRYRKTTGFRPLETELEILGIS